MSNEYRWGVIRALSEQVGALPAQVVLGMINQYPTHYVDDNGAVAPDHDAIRATMPFALDKSKYRAILKALHRSGWLMREHIRGHGRVYRIPFARLDALKRD